MNDEVMDDEAEDGNDEADDDASSLKAFNPRCTAGGISVNGFVSTGPRRLMRRTDSVRRSPSGLPVDSVSLSAAGDA